MAEVINKNYPIGIFDSGVGGLTVLNALKEKLPNEDFIYLGDMARLPYGTKSKKTVIQYSLGASEMLYSRKIKALVIACNTASSVAIEALRAFHPDIPIIGVIEPGAKSCIDSLTNNGQILVLATESTVKWQAYRNALLKLNENSNIIEWPCSMLVSLAEEGWCDGQLVEQIINRLITPAVQKYDDLECVLLGCTHFPVFTQALKNILPINCKIIDSAKTCADALFSNLESHNLLSDNKSLGKISYLVTDSKDRFAKVASKMLNLTIDLDHIALLDLPTNSPNSFSTNPKNFNELLSKFIN